MDRLNRVKKIFLLALFLAIMTHVFEINAVKKVSITIKSQSLHVCIATNIFVSRANVVRHKKQSKVSTDMKGGYNAKIFSYQKPI